MAEAKIPYFGFRDFPEGIESRVEAALLQAARQKQYVLGAEVAAFEKAFAEAVGAGFAVGVGNGYDALVLALRAVGVGAGDEVIVPANTFVATGNAVVQVGAKPVFAEPDGITYNLTAAGAAARISPKTKAIVPVHLYGQACEMEPIMELARSAGVKVLEDAAQAHGATYKGHGTGTFGHAGAFSFYPTKNLGALGDAGAVVTTDGGTVEFIRQYRNYGESTKYLNESIGINSRLDTLQAAVLNVKLPFLEKLNRERQRLAKVYLEALKGTGDLVLPYTAPACGHVYHIFNIRTGHRDALQAWLRQQGVHTAIHYPVPIHLQPAYRYLGYKTGDLPVAEEQAATSLSLPLFPGLQEAEQAAVVDGIRSFFK